MCFRQSELQQYATNPGIRARWDSLQREYSCCGGYKQGIGYQDWEGLDVDPLPYQALEFRVSNCMGSYENNIRCENEQ